MTYELHVRVATPNVEGWIPVGQGFLWQSLLLVVRNLIDRGVPASDMRVQLRTNDKNV